MTIASWGFAPALAAGNAVLLKPAEITPLTSIRLGELAVEAGLPADLFQVLPGKGSVVGDDADDRVDPCIACARLLDNLADDGLGRDVVAPGLPPRPLR